MKPVAHIRLNKDKLIIQESSIFAPFFGSKPVVYLEDVEKEMARIEALYENMCAQYSKLFKENTELLERYFEAVARAESYIGKEPVNTSSQTYALSREAFTQQLILKLVEAGITCGADRIIEEALALVYPETKTAQEECKHLSVKEEISTKGIKTRCLKCGHIVAITGAFEQ